MSHAEHSPLGKPTAYVDQYDPSLLFPIERQTQRDGLGLSAERLPFLGADLWTGYELGWLNPRGKPQIAIARFVVPCDSTHIVESKSFKLYLTVSPTAALTDRSRCASACAATSAPRSGAAGRCGPRSGCN